MFLNENKGDSAFFENRVASYQPRGFVTKILTWCILRKLKQETKKIIDINKQLPVLTTSQILVQGLTFSSFQ